MAKLKMLKYPKKPKASSSLATKERYLARVREIDKENAARTRDNKRSEALTKKIQGIGSTRKTTSRRRSRR